ncbi:energy transducer TonB [Algoriphagus sp. D3-2-R+10]|uniref:energy transducer TonB n=1 Tax=Algoriphagus aurantiacus TaxID=3103948 RepID=UPI002B3EF0ED|nr:energy transducer TonB [Algoriphagus sp. D3-2-R+10]MEB2774877.1 energy transducer TonB [Algoriphagus sp. D3-2-R+10]
MLRSLLLLCSFLVTLFSHGQTPFNPETESDFVKATYLQGNLVSILGQDFIYPEDAAANGTQGDVIYLLKIDQTGKLVSYEAKERISDELAKQARESIEALTGSWTPSKLHGKPVDRGYLLVFSYKIFYNALPLDYHAMTKKFEEKGKLEKAVRTYDDAIKNYPFNPVYYTMRAKFKKELGDEEGAKEDQLMADKMNMEVLAVVEIAQSQSVR